MSHHHHHDLVSQDLLRSHRDIAREEARTRMGDPPNTACRLKLAVGAKPNINDKMADRGRKALRWPLFWFLLATAWFLPWSWWFLILVVPWALVLCSMWVDAPKKHAAELERRRAVAGHEDKSLIQTPDLGEAMTTPMTLPLQSTGRHAR